MKFKKYGRLADLHSFELLKQRAKETESVMFNQYISKIEESILNNPKVFWLYMKSKNQTNAIVALVVEKISAICLEISFILILFTAQFVTVKYLQLMSKATYT